MKNTEGEQSLLDHKGAVDCILTEMGSTVFRQQRALKYFVLIIGEINLKSF